MPRNTEQQLLPFAQELFARVEPGEHDVKLSINEALTVPVARGNVISFRRWKARKAALERQKEGARQRVASMMGVG